MQKSKIKKLQKKLFENEMKTFSPDVAKPRVNADFLLGLVITEVAKAALEAKTASK
jgi:hypothetical protein